LGCRDAGDNFGLVACSTRGEQGIAGIDVDGYRGQNCRADGHKEGSSFHILFFIFGGALLRYRMIVLGITPEHDEPRKFF
jgi:hypothetical protein